MATNNNYFKQCIGLIIPISNQVARLKIKYPQFSVTSNNHSMIIGGYIRPTARSVLYDFRIEYKLNKMPVTRIAKGQLTRNANGEEIPHMYNQDSLCLFRPKYHQFTASCFIADTIIPWTSLWLYHYENWHITGRWQGGGEHPGVNIQ